MTQTDWQEPFTRFGTLFDEATRLVPREANSMSLATVDERGRPSVRVVLLKDFDRRGFVFYTNHLSAKGKALDATGLAALNFFWPVLEQQVRVEGTVKQVGTDEADAYFATRPRVSQLGAWASEQSQPLTSREVLEARLTVLTAKYEGQSVPRPPHWGGYRLDPDRIEFWKAHEFRLHWRDEYVRSGAGWQHSWLNP